MTMSEAAYTESPLEETEEVSSPEIPEQIFSAEEFERRRNALVEKMANDPVVRDKILAEIYLNIANMEMALRGMFETVQSQGFAGMLKSMIGRRG